MPPLLAAYAAWPIWPSNAATLAVMITNPRSPSIGSLSIMAAAASRSTLKVPTRLMSITVRKVSSGSTPRLPITRPGVATPAQFDRDPQSAQLGRSRDGRLHLIFVAYVGRGEPHPVPQLGRQLGSGRARQVDDQCRRPLRNDCPHGGRAQSRRASGHQHDIVLAQPHSPLPSPTCQTERLALLKSRSEVTSAAGGR